MNWRGRPLVSHTTTDTGLLVQCVLDTGDYPTGIRYTDTDVAALPLHRHDFLGEWIG